MQRDLIDIQAKQAMLREQLKELDKQIFRLLNRADMSEAMAEYPPMAALVAPLELLRRALAAIKEPFTARDLQAYLESMRLRLPSGSITPMLRRLQMEGLITVENPGRGRIAAVFKPVESEESRAA